MSLQTLALAFMAATAVGGVAWVFLYPALSGEAKAEKRRAAFARTVPAVRQVDRAQRSRREQVEGSLREIEQRLKRDRKLALTTRIAQAGLSWSKEKFLIISGILGAVCFAVPMFLGAGPIAAVGARFRGGVRFSALVAGLPQDAPRKEVSQGTSGCGRRDCPRYQGRLAAVRIPQGRRGRLARAGEKRIPRRSSRRRRSACHSARPVRDCSSGCRFRKRTSSAS